MPRRKGRGSVTTFQLEMAGLGTPIEVRRSPRARRFTLRVNEAQRGAVLTMPLNVSMKEANAFLSRHTGWLKGRLAALPEPVPFADGQLVPLRGLEHVIQFVGRPRGSGVVWTDAPEDGMEQMGFRVAQELPLMPRLPAICVTGGREHAPRRLTDWLRREARKDLAARVAWHAVNLDLRAKRVSVRDQATRWGSCSSEGSLSFSWRLILAPPFVLDYVAAHEVAHLKEMNHGPRFWRLVKKSMPRMEEARRWLKAHGSDLHRYGAGDGKA